MTGSARETRAARALLTRSAEGFTGRMSVGSGEATLSVHLLGGELIGASSADDVSRVVRLLTMRGVLTAQESEFFERHIAAGERVLGEVLDVAEGPLLDAVLRDRFIQNLADFVATDHEPASTPDRSVFLDNVQMGHDTEALVLATCNDVDVAVQLDLEQLVMRGHAEVPRGVSVSLLMELIHARPRTVQSVLDAVPMEPLRARRMLVDLIEAGVVEESTETGPDPTPLPPRTVETDNVQVVEDDLDVLAAFDDHDRVRGAGGAGNFSTEDHHRDVVEVADLGGGSDPVLRVVGPQVQDGQARQKVRVANEVLTKVAAALDREQGSGRGQASIQLLVAGGPSRYSVLTRDLPVSEEGEVSEPMLLMNLRKRPAAEQHQLLHTALLDLIERGLSIAADNLSEDALDTLFDSVAGYRSRMGR